MMGLISTHRSIIATLFLTIFITFLNDIIAQEYPKWKVTESSDFQDYSISHRQSVCDRQQSFNSRNVSLRNALRGFQLHPWFPLGTFSPLANETGAIFEDNPGYTVEILDELASRAEFSWRNSFGVADLKYIGNATIDDVLKWTVHTYDVSVAQWVRAKRRVESGVVFPDGIYDSSIIMVGIQDDGSSPFKFWSFLEPFSWQVWVMILVTFVVAGMIYLWMEWLNDDSDRQKLSKMPTETVFYAAMSITGDSRFEPSTDYARLFVFALAFWSLMIASAYTANLASFLVVENTPSLKIETLDDAVRMNLPICVIEGTQPDTLLSQEYPGATIIRKNIALGEKATFLGVLKGECTLALTTINSWDSHKHMKEVNEDCRMKWVGRVVRFMQAGFATFSDSGSLCTSLIRDVFNIHLLEMQEQGVITRLWDKYIELNSDLICDGSEISNSNTENGDGKLSLKEMGGLFVAFYLVAASTVCIALFHTWKVKRKWRRQSNYATSVNNTGMKGSEDKAVASTLPEECASLKLAEQVGATMDKLNSVQLELEALRSAIGRSNMRRTDSGSISHDA